jgi:SSS family transporter
MSIIDWVVLCAFLGFIVIYGVLKSRGSKNIKEFLLANKSAPWFTVTLSIMATQASAITFLSTPGQAYVDGMRFVQFYIGLPIAMIILSVTAVPLFHKLNAYTAYEYLEQRFDLKNRALGSILFLIQRGLAAGFTILAPSLILSVILGWDLNYTIIILGILVIIYTASGGTSAVNKTHLLQMAVIFTGMVAAFIMIFQLLPTDISTLDAIKVAGKSGKLKAIDFSFNLGDRYTFWSGLIGGTFLALSYFGTDQSQVQRYLAGSSIKESRTGLLMNGIIKIPMQFFILFTGAMVFVFYQFTAPPLYFNPVEEEKIRNSAYVQDYENIEIRYQDLHQQKQENLRALLDASDRNEEPLIEQHQARLHNLNEEIAELRSEAKDVLKKANPSSDGNDTNYIFLSFVIGFLPVGLIGLVLAAILSASMSSTSAELNALASTTVVDIYKRMVKKDAGEGHYVIISKLATIFWGFYAIAFALFANQLGTLIEAVNVLGSLFYGTILGIFLVAFFMKKTGGTATFIAALLAEATVLLFFIFTDIPYLWFNFIGCMLVVIFALIIEFFIPHKQKDAIN